MDAHPFDRYFAEKYPVLVGHVTRHVGQLSIWTSRDH